MRCLAEANTVLLWILFLVIIFDAFKESYCLRSQELLACCVLFWTLLSASRERRLVSSLGTAHSRALVQIEQHSFINRLGYESENIKATNFLFFCYNVKGIRFLDDSLACLLSYSQSCLSRGRCCQHGGDRNGWPGRARVYLDIGGSADKGLSSCSAAGSQFVLEDIWGWFEYFRPNSSRVSLEASENVFGSNNTCPLPVISEGGWGQSALGSPHQGSAWGLRWGLLPPAQGRTSLTGLLPGGGGLW